MTSPHDAPVLPLTKEDAAEHALDAAINLHLCEGDPVAVHLLAFSALHVLRGVALAKGLRTPYIDFHGTLEKGAEFKARFDEAYVFMKHGKQDPDAVLEVFRPAANFLVLAVAAGEFVAVFGRQTPGMSAFKQWLEGQHPDLYFW